MLLKAKNATLLGIAFFDLLLPNGKMSMAQIYTQKLNVKSFWEKFLTKHNHLRINICKHPHL